VITTSGRAARPGSRVPGRAAVVGLLAVLAVTGCSGAVTGRPDGAAPAPTAAPATPSITPAPRLTPRAPTPAPVDPTAGLDTAAEGLRPFLLTPEEIGPGFTAGAEPQPDPTAPAICGGPGVVAQYPIAVRVGAGFDGPLEGVFVQQTVSVYGDVATADAAYQAYLDGLSCSEGNSSGDPVVLTPAEDLSVDVPADRSTGWQIGGPGYDLILIAVRSGELVVNFAFVAPEGQSADLPDPLSISRAGVEKLAG
jgi:hypothetical protein